MGVGPAMPAMRRVTRGCPARRSVFPIMRSCGVICGEMDTASSVICSVRRAVARSIGWGMRLAMGCLYHVRIVQRFSDAIRLPLFINRWLIHGVEGGLHLALGRMVGVVGLLSDSRESCLGLGQGFKRQNAAAEQNGFADFV